MATVEKVGQQSWRISMIYEGVRYRTMVKSSKHPGKKEAEEIIIKYISKKLNRRPTKAYERLTFRDAAARYIKVKELSLSPSTIRSYSSNLKHMPEWFTKIYIDDLEKITMQKLANQYMELYKPKSIQNIMGFVRSVVNMYLDNFTFRITYPRQIEPYKEPYIPTADEIRCIVKLAEGTDFQIPILLAACCGLRRSEILALTLDDIDDNNILHINKALIQQEGGEYVLKCTKTPGSVRNVAVPPEVMKLINEKGSIYNSYPNSIERWLLNAEEELGIEYFTFHKLRHYFCTTLHENGVSDATIMKLGGWSDPSIMQRVYRHGSKSFDVMVKAAGITSAGIII